MVTVDGWRDWEIEEVFKRTYSIYTVVGGLVLVLALVFGAGFLTGRAVYRTDGAAGTENLDGIISTQQQLTDGIAGAEERVGSVKGSLERGQQGIDAAARSAQSVAAGLDEGQRRIDTAALRAGGIEANLIRTGELIAELQHLFAADGSSGEKEKTAH